MSQELLQQYGILLIIVGLTLVVLLLVFLVLRRRAMKKKGLRPAAAAAAMEMADEVPMLDETPEPQLAEKNEPAKSDGGFTLFKRKKPKASKKAVSSEKQAELDAQRLAKLEDLEQQMLAIRELFRDGEITRSVYIAETKALYDIAQELR